MLLNGLFRKWPAVFCHSAAEQCAMLVSLFPSPVKWTVPKIKCLSGVRDTRRRFSAFPGRKQSPSESWEGQRCKKMKKWSSWTKRTVPAVIIPTWHTEPNPDQQKRKTTDNRGMQVLQKRKNVWKHARESLNERVALSLPHPLDHARRLAQIGQTGHHRASRDIAGPQSLWAVAVTRYYAQST